MIRFASGRPRQGWHVARRLCAVVPCVIGICVGGATANAQSAPRSALDTIEFDAIVEKLRTLDAPGAMILIKEGNVSRFQAIGFADLPGRRPMRRNLPWRAASVTKVMTGIVVLQLARERKVDLDDAIGLHLKIRHKAVARSTIRQLLQHTSGIPDYMAHPGSPLQTSSTALVEDLLRKRDPDRLLQKAAELDTTFVPGAVHLYSNTNYILLGRLIETIEGRSFADSVAARVVGPLGLANTGFPDARGRLPKGAIRGYVASDSATGPFTDTAKLQDVTEHTNFLGADGGVYASIDDLARVLSTLPKGLLLTKSEFKRMTGNMVEDHDGLYRYGLGIAAYPTVCKTIVYGHEGRDLGLFTVALTDRDAQRQLVLVINRSADSFSALDRVVSEVRDAAFCSGAPK